MLYGSDETVDQSDALFVGLALHNRSDSLLDVRNVVQTFHLETLNDFTEDLVALLLSLAVLSEKLNILHQSDVVLSLQLDFLEDSDKHIKLEKHLGEGDALGLLLLDQLSEGHEEEVVKSTDFGDR